MYLLNIEEYTDSIQFTSDPSVFTFQVQWPRTNTYTEQKHYIKTTVIAKILKAQLSKYRNPNINRKEQNNYILIQEKRL